MKFNLQDIYKAMENIENGKQMIADIQEEIGGLRREAATHRMAKKQVMDAFGIKDGESIEGAASGYQALLQKVAAFEADHAKRQEEARMTQIRTAFEEGGARDPELCAFFVASKVKTAEDGSLSFQNGEKTLSLEDGVKAWLDSNPQRTRSLQKPGMGSGPGNVFNSNQQNIIGKIREVMGLEDGGGNKK